MNQPPEPPPSPQCSAEHRMRLESVEPVAQRVIALPGGDFSFLHCDELAGDVDQLRLERQGRSLRLDEAALRISEAGLRIAEFVFHASSTFRDPLQLFPELRLALCVRSPLIEPEVLEKSSVSLLPDSIGLEITVCGVFAAH